MRQQRWFPIAALAVGLFAINVAARLVARFAYDSSDSGTAKASIAMFILVAVVLAVRAFIQSHVRKPSEWLPPMAGAALIGLALSVIAGPFINGDQPFSSGPSYFFGQVGMYAICATIGLAMGYWISVALGRDYRSRALKAYTEVRSSKPRKVVRR